MFLEFIRYHGSLEHCKKYYAYVVILISFLIIFEFHGYFFIIHKKSDSQPVIKMENDSNVAVSVIYDGRSKILSSNCGRSGPSVVDITSYAPMNLINSYPWLAAALYPVESQSVMYCAVPKIASKTLVSLMMYVYIRDIIEHLSNNSTNTTINRHWVQQHINIPVLAAQLEKV